MDILTFISEETKSAAWPGVVFSLVLVFKKQITSLLFELGKRIRAAKGAGFEVSFGEVIDEVEQSEVANNSLPTESLVPKKDIQNATLPPAYIISQSWLNIESFLSKALGKIRAQNGYEVLMPPVAGKRRLKEALDQKLIDADEFNILINLLSLRNRAVHEQEPDISLTDALRYQNLAENIGRMIELRSKQ